MTYRGHVEATFESAHKADVPGHKCSGTLRGVPKDVTEEIRRHFDYHGLGDADGLLSNISGMFDYHGHSWLAEIDFEYTKVDEHFWGPDFGKVKDIIRAFDHHNLNLFMEQPTAEAISRRVFETFRDKFGFYPKLVRLHEGRGNRMEFIGDS